LFARRRGLPGRSIFATFELPREIARRRTSRLVTSVKDDPAFERSFGKIFTEEDFATVIISSPKTRGRTTLLSAGGEIVGSHRNTSQLLFEHAWTLQFDDFTPGIGRFAERGAAGEMTKMLLYDDNSALESGSGLHILSKHRKYFGLRPPVSPNPGLPSRRIAALGLLFIVTGLLASCSGSSVSANPAEVEASQAEMIGDQAHSDERLQELHRQRSADAFTNKLGIGPGDLIEITVAGVPELTKYKARVSEDGTIAVPLAGITPAAGITEDDLRQALRQRMEKLVKNPQIEVFVDQYHSRNVAVVGMVHKPGLYSIVSRSDTILDMIDRAGGITDLASSTVLFIPAPAQGQQRQQELAKALTLSVDETPQPSDMLHQERASSMREKPEQVERVRPVPSTAEAGANPAVGSPRMVSLLALADPIEVDLMNAARASKLNVPVRPGDTIVVPAAGEVMVDGWVANPGAFKIAPGMTALAAVSAAGGALFSDTAEVLRRNQGGGRRAIVVSLSKIRKGEESDVPVQEGDVVFVRRSSIGAVPYALYEMFSKFGTGMYLPIP
jgi:polysaccharide biosynthesis/export protein